MTISTFLKNARIVKAEKIQHCKKMNENECTSMYKTHKI